MLYNFKFLKIKFDNLIKQFQFYFIKEYIHALNIKNIKKIFKIFIKNVIYIFIKIIINTKINI